MKNPERQPDTIFKFLGIVTQFQPEVLEQLTARDKYILLTHSDISNTRTLAEMTTIFEASTNTVGRAYKRALKTVYDHSDPQIQEDYPFAEIEKSIRVRHKDTCVERTREAFSDPEKRKDILTRMSEGHRRSYLNNSELRRKTSLASTGRRHSPEESAKISVKLKGKKRPLWHLASLRGKKRPPEVGEKVSIAQLKRFQDPTERQRQATYGFEGKKHTEETKRKMSNAAVKRTARYDTGWESKEDVNLWKYAKVYNLIPRIIETGYLTQDEIYTIDKYFSHGKKSKNLSRLLNKLSLAIANLD